MALWLLNASGGWTRHSLLDWKARSTDIATADLTGDGLLDIVMVAGNLPIGPALMVWLGQPNDIPAFEGYYPLLGEGGQILTGDVNGDGDTDLVVLGKSPASNNGGVFVLTNQGTPATAVASESGPTPTAFALGANYPNPFNPATTIPLAVPARAKNVTLTIYNVLGQPLRQVWTGPLPAGEHELTWDGRDAQGQPVATGVYMYRVQSGRADAHSQNGQTRIDEPSKLNKVMHYALLIGLLCSATAALAVDSLDVGQGGRLGRWDSIVEEAQFLGGSARFHLDVAGRSRRKPVAALGPSAEARQWGW